MKPPLDPDCADLAPSDRALTRYDEEHLVTYLRMLDANADRADWRGLADRAADRRGAGADRARRAFDSHLSRAKRMAEIEYRQSAEAGLWR